MVRVTGEAANCEPSVPSAPPSGSGFSDTGSSAALPPKPPPQPRTVDRLRPRMPADRLGGWVFTGLVTVIAFAIRIVHLGRPGHLVFDETYYAKDAYSLITSGYERAWPKHANHAVAAGHPDVMKHAPEFIVHPPLGKWLIGAGEQLFGMNSFGWRIASVVFGSLAILVVIRLVRRVSRSTLIGCTAGVLLSVDGLEFVMSRIALLDIFLMFFMVAGVACLAADRDWFRSRLADHLEATGQPDLGYSFGPVVWLRPWRLAAGVLFGLAVASKWNAVYAIAAFALLSLAWDIGARKLAGAGRRSAWGLLRDGIPSFVMLVILPAILYVASWVNWFATSGGWDRQWGVQHPGAGTVKFLGAPFASFLKYQSDILGFHTGSYIDSQTHPYNANPGGWLILARTTGIDATNNIKPGTHGCPAGGEQCIRVITALGTPVLWWGALAALVIALILWVGGRDWRFGIPIVGVLCNWLPWFGFTARPQFLFYAITIIPFSVMAVALCLGLLIGRRPVPATANTVSATAEQAVRGPGDDSARRPGRRRRIAGTTGAGVFVALVIADFGYLYPVFTDQLMHYSSCLSRMWLSGWI